MIEYQDERAYRWSVDGWPLTASTPIIALFFMLQRRVRGFGKRVLKGSHLTNSLFTLLSGYYQNSLEAFTECMNRDLRAGFFLYLY